MDKTWGQGQPQSSRRPGRRRHQRGARRRRLQLPPPLGLDQPFVVRNLDEAQRLDPITTSL